MKHVKLLSEEKILCVRVYNSLLLEKELGSFKPTISTKFNYQEVERLCKYVLSRIFTIQEESFFLDLKKIVSDFYTGNNRIGIPK